MRKRNSAWIALVAAGLAAASLGCEGQPPKPEAKAKDQAAESSPPAASKPVVAKPTAPAPAPPSARKEKPLVTQIGATAGLSSSAGTMVGTAAQASRGAPPGEKEPAAAPKKAARAKPVKKQFAPRPLPRPPAEKPRRAPAAPLPPPTGIPKVELADMDAKMCLVKVGDVLPDAELPDLAGKKQQLRDLYGPRLTIVFFWSAEGPYGVEELQDMANGLCDSFADKGLRVIGVDCGDSAAVATENASAAAATFPILLDDDGALLAKVARARLPRSYLLDASGRILWFDMEYSRSTQHDLIQAMEAVLGK